MRVLHCIWRMGLGGAERQLAQLSSGLMARNVEVHVVTVFAGVYDPLLAATGAITHRLHPLGKYDATLIPRMVPLLRRIKPDAEGEIILFAGRRAAQKNIELLLDALAMVLAERPATAIFCGDGLQRAAFESKASSLGIAHRTRFLGSVPNVWSWMKVASVVVSPSLFEGDPNVVLEAIAARAPLVVSDIAPHRALLNERTAWLVDPRSPD